MRLNKFDICVLVSLVFTTLFLLNEGYPIEASILGFMFALCLYVSSKIPDKDAKEKMQKKQHWLSEKNEN